MVSLLGLLFVVIVGYQFLTSIVGADDEPTRDNGAIHEQSNNPSLGTRPGSTIPGFSKNSTPSSDTTTPTPNSNSAIDRSAARKRVERAGRRAESAIDECRASGKWKEAAVESFLLADSLEKMYHSDQYFGDGGKLESYLTAFEAAEDARDNAMDLQDSRTLDVNIRGTTPDQVEREYRRNMVASALMIAWCAGGLVGESRLETARAIFQTSVAPSTVESWNSFKKLLKKECGEYGAH